MHKTQYYTVLFKKQHFCCKTVNSFTRNKFQSILNSQFALMPGLCCLRYADYSFARQKAVQGCSVLLLDSAIIFFSAEEVDSEKLPLRCLSKHLLPCRLKTKNHFNFINSFFSNHCSIVGFQTSEKYKNRFLNNLYISLSSQNFSLSHSSISNSFLICVPPEKMATAADELFLTRSTKEFMCKIMP